MKGWASPKARGENPSLGCTCVPAALKMRDKGAWAGKLKDYISRYDRWICLGAIGDAVKRLWMKGLDSADIWVRDTLLREESPML